MTNADTTIIISIISLFFNLLMITIQSRIRGELSELKAHMYEHFATKNDVRHMMKRSP
jgi:hypothetical protein